MRTTRMKLIVRLAHAALANQQRLQGSEKVDSVFIGIVLVSLVVGVFAARSEPYKYATQLTCRLSSDHRCLERWHLGPIRFSVCEAYHANPKEPICRSTTTTFRSS